MPAITDSPTRAAAPAALCLSIGAFGVGVGEFATMGLLPQIAQDLGVSVTSAGMAVSSYALGVVVGAPLLTATTAHVGRKLLLVCMAALMAIGNIVVSFSPSLGVLVTARFFTGLPHGVYLGVAGVVAAALASPDRRGTAVSRVMLGLTVANIVGVPLATVLGTLVTWRAAFLVIAGIFLINLFAIAAFVPRVKVGSPAPAEARNTPAGEAVAGRAAESSPPIAHPQTGATTASSTGAAGTSGAVDAAGTADTAETAGATGKPETPDPQRPSTRRELRALVRPQVLLTLLAGAVGFGGMFAVYTFISPTITELAGAPATAVPWVLAVYGVGMTLGTLMAGPLVDRSIDRSCLGATAFVAVALIAFALLAGNIIMLFIGIGCIGLGGSLLNNALQVRLMRESQDAPSMASAMNHAAFNLANALGAYLGGVVIDAGLGYRAPAAVGLVLTLLGLAVLVIAVVTGRRQRRATRTIVAL